MSDYSSFRFEVAQNSCARAAASSSAFFMCCVFFPVAVGLLVGRNLDEAWMDDAWAWVSRGRVLLLRAGHSSSGPNVSKGG